MPVIPALRRLRWEGHEFEASLGYIVKTGIKKLKIASHQWLMPVILATQRQQSGGLRFEASPGK
jgi:hypothetical protein